MDPKKLTLRKLNLAVAGACACMAAAAQQAASPAAPTAAAASAAENGNGTQSITVTGFRRSAETSLNIKRDADGFVDALTSDALGRFPDLNVGEALTRIPGIQINREGTDRSATVNLRGLPGTFARVTLNGQAFADPAISGSTPLGAFSSDVFTGFVVRKSPNASDKAGGLSGIIDLQIQGALSRAEGGSIKLGAEYNTLGKSTSPSVTASYNKRLGKDLAMYGVATYKREHFRRDTVQPNTFQQLNLGNATFVRSSAVGALPAVGNTAAAVTNLAAFADYYAAPGTTLAPGEVVLDVPANRTSNNQRIVGTGLKSKYGVQFLNQARQGIRETEGDLFSLAAGAELRASDALSFNATLFHTRRNLSQTTSDQGLIGFGQGSTLVTADPGSLFTTAQGLNYVNSFSFINGSYNSGRRSDVGLNQTSGVTASASWKGEQWRAVTDISVSKARGLFEQVVLSSQQNPGSITAANPAGNGSVGTFNGGYGDVANYVVTRTSPGNTLPGGTLSINGITATTTPAQAALFDVQQVRGTTGDWLQITGLYQTSRNEVGSIAQSFERHLTDLPLTSVKFGAGHEINNYKTTAFVPSPVGVNAAAINPNLLQANERADSFFGGKNPGYLTAWPVINAEYAMANLKPTAASLVPGQPLTPAGAPLALAPNGWVNNPNNTSYLTGNFDNDYRINSAFVMGNFDTTLASVPVRGNVGLRYEQLKKSITTLERTLNTVGNVSTPRFDMREFESTFNKSLPSFMIAAEPVRNLVLRYAAYETYVAPQRRDENPVTAVSKSSGAAGTTSTNYTIALGKKDLKPYTALSQDIGIEWYNRKGSVVGLNYYHKNVKGYTYAINGANNPELACPSSGIFDGTDYGIGPLRPYDIAAPAGQNCRAVNDDPNNLIGGVAAPVYVSATGATNNPNVIKVRGIELILQQNLSFLPAPWSNFGGQANFSHTTIDGTLPSGGKVFLDGVSKGNYNLIGFYETGQFGIRLIFNHRTKYELPGGQTFTGNAKTAKPRNQVDMSASYRFGDAITLSLDGFNLTDSLREDYDQDKRVLRVSNYDGRTYRLTLSARF